MKKSEKEILEFADYLLKTKYKTENLEFNPEILKNLGIFPFEVKDFNSLNKIIEEIEKNLQIIKSCPITFDVTFYLLKSEPIFANMHKKDKLSENLKENYEKFLSENKDLLENLQKSNSPIKKKADQGNFGFDIKGEVTTRFPPEPSGYLHIGHCKAALLNNYFAEKNNGTIRIRFDDTNQNKEYEKYEKIIIDDLKLLNIKDYKLSSTSDYFDELLEKGEQLIKQHDAYCDNTDKETMRNERDLGIKSKNRENSVEENLKIFNEMKKGENADYCVRAKISVDNKNKALRDPVIFRINTKEHHKTKFKYKLYPTYDMAVPVVDSIEGVTFCLRTNEFRDRNDQYHWIQKKLNLKKIKICDFGRLNFENTVLSKRKLSYFVENDLVEGWDDPRVPTIRGILRKGMQIEALKDYILKQGTSQKNCISSWDKIWAINKKMIDPKSERYSAIKKENSVEIEIVNDFIADLKKTDIEIKGKDENLFFIKTTKLGNKEINLENILLSQEDSAILTENEEFTLMGLGNFIVKEIEIKDNIVKKIKVESNLQGDFKTTKNKFNFVSSKDSVTVNLIEFGDLTIKEGDEDVFNKDSKFSEEFIAEKAVKNVKKGETVQFERIGFYYCDDINVFNLVPFTKQKRKN